LAPAKHGPGFNGGPALFARKPVLLLVCHLLQHVIKLLTPTAFKFANLIIMGVWIMIGFVQHCLHVYGLCYANILSLHFIFIFFKSNIKN
jgi:hypothetical protein